MMKFWNRKVLAGIAVGLAIAAGTAGMYQMETTKPVSAAAQEQRQAPQFDVNKAAKHIADSFGVDESQVRAAIEDRRDFRDIGRAAALAKLSGKSFQDVLAMKTDSNTWKEVRNALGVTEEAERNLQTERMAEHICQDTTIDRDEAIRLLKDGYSPRDIQAAALLSKASGKDIRDVLGMEITRTREDDEGNWQMVWMKGGLQLIAAPEDWQKGQAHHLGLVVEDFEQARKRMLAAPGVEQVPGKPEKWLRLPDGLTIELFQEVSGAIEQLYHISVK